ncbi:MAG: WbqC family protein [Sphingobacteriales bacterium JAD_PAG50586_3]|nr:MAG: WbqC family protein [Sphingobacteriales bacterium JAD_PAG50586_3]
MEIPLLSTAYLPPVEYISILAKHTVVEVETQEHFVKQTYRNRAVILSANGPLALIIPLKKGKNNNQLITEVEIDYSSNWQTAHWRSIASAYGGSAYYEHYADYFSPFYTKRYQFLFEFNAHLLNQLLVLFKLKCDVKYTDSFIPLSKVDNDYRYTISPKVKSNFQPKPYRQVFSEKFGFVPEMSSLDLLFNVGNRSVEFLQQS